MGCISSRAQVELMLIIRFHISPDGPDAFDQAHPKGKPRRNALRASFPLASSSTSHMQPTKVASSSRSRLFSIYMYHPAYMD